ncbi:MAG: FecR domain-containing protein [Ectothiorhodospiraceae bacterium]|nr:FecR domain-containing protein [Ectothiorhodospiraceae bacterium]
MALAALAALPNAGARAQDWIYTARPGDTLWDLTERYLVSLAYVERLRAYNDIAEPTALPPGRRIRVPIRWLRVQPAPARVIEVVGAAEMVDAGGATAPLTAGQQLATGDRVRTPTGASTTIEFADGSRMVVLPESDVEMDSLSMYGDTGMVDSLSRLRGGRVESTVRPAVGPGSRFRIGTPAAVAAARGTGFRVGYSADDGAARTEVTEGTVGVSDERQTRTLSAGFGVVARPGERLARPRPLLPAPDLSALPARQERPIVRLAWPAVADAVRYRAQIFAGESAERLLLDTVVDAPATALEAPPDGDYLLSVRAIDAESLEGLDARLPIVVDALPLPPPPLRPPHEAAMPATNVPELWWSVPQDAAAFRLQIADNPAFSPPLLVDTELDGDRFTPPGELPPGTYYWRLSTRTASGDVGPFGDTRAFRLQLVPPGVEAAPPAVGEETVEFSWSEALGAVRYEFDLARDEGFTDIVEHLEVDSPRVQLPTPSAGVYYFRARGVSAENVPGTYGPPSRLEVPSNFPWWLLPIGGLLLILL